MGFLLWSLGLTLGFLIVRAGGQVDCGGTVGSGIVCGPACTNVKPAIPRSLSQAYSERELFINIVPLSELGAQLDNICFTFFRVVANPNVYVFYSSRVFKNGTNFVRSFLISQDTLGVFKSASPDCGPFNDTVIGQDQCNTYLNYRCYPCDGCPNRIDNDIAPVYGLSRSNQPIPPSCFKQSMRVIQSSGVPPQQYIPLPMKLPSRCVTRQNCVNYQPSCSN